MKEYNEEIYVVDGNDVICVGEEYCEEVELGHGVSDEEYYREFCAEPWGDEDDDYEELGDGFGSDFEEPFSVIFEEYEDDGKDVGGQPRKIA